MFNLSSPQLAQMSLIGQVGGMFSSAIGSYYSSATQKINLQGQAELAAINGRIADSLGETNSFIADTNARIAELSAQGELRRGQREEQNSRLKTAQVKSAQRTSMAANGLDLGSASALRVLTTTDVMGEIDANTIASNAVRSAWGYRTQAANYQTEAASASLQGRILATNSANEALVKSAAASAVSPFGSAASSLLGSAGSVASSWFRYRKETKGAE